MYLEHNANVYELLFRNREIKKYVGHRLRLELGIKNLDIFKLNRRTIHGILMYALGIMISTFVIFSFLLIFLNKL